MELQTLEFEVEQPLSTLTERELYRLCCTRWKEVCELFCEKLGFEIDGNNGKEQRFFLKRPGDETVVAYARCYRLWNRRITVADLEKVEKRMQALGIQNGVIFTRAGFSKEALQYAKGKPFDLITIKVLLKDILKLERDDIEEIETLARKIVILAPCCPQCRKPMIHAKNHVGGYWRCSNYPRCSVTYMK